MSKVFEALLRQQQSEQNSRTATDPLAEQTGLPNGLPDGLEANGHADFELPSVIGTPVGPRSNEGALFASFNQQLSSEASPKPENGNSAHHDNQIASPAATTTANGKPAVESRRAISVNSRAIAERLKTERLKKAPPVIRQTPAEVEAPAAEPEIRNLQSDTLADTSAETLAEPLAPTRKRQHEVPVEPIVQSRLHPRLLLLTDPQAPECEQYRTLRTQLFHAAEKKKTQVVTITSTLAGEGKTSTVINLGLAIAQSEKRVLIIDGDLRRPNVAAYLGVKPKTGFGETLTGDVNALDSLFTLEGHEMYVLAVNRESANPTELLSSERLAGLIAELRGYFDFILIDSPPVLPFADARLLANHADAVVLVIRAGMASYETVEKAIEALPAAKMLGVVLNGAEDFEESGYYDYYYNYSHQNRRRTWWQKLLSPIKKTTPGRKLKL